MAIHVIYGTPDEYIHTFEGQEARASEINMEGYTYNIFYTWILGTSSDLTEDLLVDTAINLGLGRFYNDTS